MDNPHHKGNTSKNVVEIMSCITQLMTKKKTRIVHKGTLQWLKYIESEFIKITSRIIFILMIRS